jgi:hypothetical protein
MISSRFSLSGLLLPFVFGLGLLSGGLKAQDPLIGLIHKYKLNWTGFSFHPKCAPCAILDWNYTPTPYWGVFVKDALAGKQFDVKRMR